MEIVDLLKQTPLFNEMDKTDLEELVPSTRVETFQPGRVILREGRVGAAGRMGCALIRLLKGPSAQDRVLALDCMYLSGMLVMLVLGLLYGSKNYFEAALLLALFSFVGSMAMAKFLLRGEVIE